MFDLTTFIFQIINFLILLFLLYFFLFKKILKVMEKREKNIEEGIQQAKQEKQQAEEEQKKYAEKIDKFERKKEEFIENAKQQAESEKEKLLSLAKEKINKQEIDWKEDLEKRKEQIYDEIKNFSIKESFNLSEKALKDLGDVSIETKIINKFLKKIHQNEDQLKDLKETGKIIIYSSFPLFQENKNKIENALKEILKTKFEIEFKENKKLISGIRLEMNHLEITWNIENFLEEMKRKFFNILNQKI